MNIPPKYENIVAELEVLREGIIALNPESVLKQEADYLDQIATLQQRLTVAEQRADRYMALLECVIDTGELTNEKHEQLESDICDEVKKFWERDAALKPAAGDHRD